jgi:hypothetical protein
MTENGLVFRTKKNHILVVANLVENLKKKIKFSNFQKKEYFGG